MKKLELNTEAAKISALLLDKIDKFGMPYKRRYIMFRSKVNHYDKPNLHIHCVKKCFKNRQKELKIKEKSK